MNLKDYKKKVIFSSNLQMNECSRFPVGWNFKRQKPCTFSLSDLNIRTSYLHVHSWFWTAFCRSQDSTSSTGFRGQCLKRPSVFYVLLFTWQEVTSKLECSRKALLIWAIFICDSRQFQFFHVPCLHRFRFARRDSCLHQTYMFWVMLQKSQLLIVFFW